MTLPRVFGTTRLFSSVLVAAAIAGSCTLAQTAAPASAKPAAGVPIKYFCYSTDPKQRVVYFSAVFDLPDTGSEAENFMGYTVAKDDFQIYLVDKYKYSEVPDLVDCSYVNTAGNANASAMLAAKKKALVAKAVAAKKKAVETGWKNAKAAKQDDDDPIGPGGFITPPTR